ncbi:hypothetical protein [Pediococcus argentinicus]|uniref:hypothetical protein n=1 Tax=Pediococcus argentinicus TaxID=480391 RepID=UPI0011BDAD16|nr:hypothetical protein [Pediococcus argentinicus]NKZ21616.1 hypothetical protein [Pediococcus argentinicus]
MLKEKKNVIRPIFVISLFALFFILPLLLNNGIIFGRDTSFHFNRIFDAYAQIKYNKFSYFQSNFGFDKSGRLVNALYGPYFAYVLGFILLIVKSWFRFQLVTSFLVFFTGGYGLFKLSKRLGANEFFSLVSSALFMATPWLAGWINITQFTSMGTMLLPFIAILGSRMLDTPDDPINPLSLGFVMAIITEVHLLSSIFAVLFLIPCFIIGFIRSSVKLQMFLKAGLSVLIYLVLTSNIWVAMITVFSKNNVAHPFSNIDMASSALSIGTGMMSPTSLGLVLSILIIFQISWMFINNVDWKIRDLTIIGLVFIVLSSNLLPWNRLAVEVPPLSFNLQFPSRIITMGAIILLAMIAVTLTELSNKGISIQKATRVSVIILSSLLIFEAYSNTQGRAQKWNDDNMPINKDGLVHVRSKATAKTIKAAYKDTNPEKAIVLVKKPIPDYLPLHAVDQTKVNLYKVYSDEILNNESGFEKHAYKNGVLEIKWKDNKKGQKLIPAFAYQQSRVTLNGKAIDPKTTKLGTILVDSKKGNNNLTLRYVQPKFFNALLVVSIIFWIAILIGLLVTTL